MNKSELIESVVKTTALGKREVEDTVNALIHTIVTEVKGGRRVAVVGFGAFAPTRRSARTGRNPQTGASVRIPASKGIRFSPSTTIKSVLNGKAPLAAPKLSTRVAVAKKAAAPVKKAAVAKKGTKKK